MIIKIGDQEKTFETELSSKLCPIDNGVSAYSIFECYKQDVSTPEPCSTGLVTVDPKNGRVTLIARDPAA